MCERAMDLSICKREKQRDREKEGRKERAMEKSFASLIWHPDLLATKAALRRRLIEAIDNTELMRVVLQEEFASKSVNTLCHCITH